MYHKLKLARFREATPMTFPFQSPGTWNVRDLVFHILHKTNFIQLCQSVPVLTHQSSFPHSVAFLAHPIFNRCGCILSEHTVVRCLRMHPLLCIPRKLVGSVRASSCKPPATETLFYHFYSRPILSNLFICVLLKGLIVLAVASEL